MKFFVFFFLCSSSILFAFDDSMKKDTFFTHSANPDFCYELGLIIPPGMIKSIERTHESYFYNITVENDPKTKYTLFFITSPKRFSLENLWGLAEMFVSKEIINCRTIKISDRKGCQITFLTHEKGQKPIIISESLILYNDTLIIGIGLKYNDQKTAETVLEKIYSSIDKMTLLRISPASIPPEILSTDQDVPGMPEWKLYQNIAQCFFVEKKYLAAEKYLSLAIAINSKESRLFFQRGLVLRILKHDDRALSDFTRAIELSPEYAAAYHFRGEIYRNGAKLDSALMDYTKAVELKPDYADAYYQRGTLFFFRKEYDKAINDFSTVIKLKEDYPNVHFFRGSALFCQKKYDAVIKDCSRELELNAKSVDAHLLRGNAYSLQGRPKDAILDYNQSIKLKPNNIATIYARAHAYVKSGKYEDAISDYKEILTLPPDHRYSPWAYLNGIELLLITGQKEIADQWLGEAAKYNASWPSSSQVIFCYLDHICGILHHRSSPEKDGLKLLLDKKTPVNWNFTLIEKWLESPPNGLAESQITEIRSLTEEIRKSRP